MSPFRRALAVVTAVALVACSSSTAGTPGGDNGGDCKAGKNAAFANPAGTPFVLPAGVTLADEITGDTMPNCGDKSFVEYGGDFLGVCIGLKNGTAADVTVTLPAGLVFISKDPTSQNGIILQSHDLKVAAGETTYFSFRLFCIDEHCIYGRKEDRYTFGNVSNDPKIAELIALAKSKKLVVGSDAAAAFLYAVWDVTDGDGLTPAHRAQIDAAE